MPRAITHLNTKASQRETTPENLARANHAFGKDIVELKTESEPSLTESIVSASLKLSIEQARSKFASPVKRQNPSTKEQFQSLSTSDVNNAETYQLSFPSVRGATVSTGLLESNSTSKPASPRAASKIPTPLARKPVKSSPTSSDSALTSSSGPIVGALKGSPSKMHPASSSKSGSSTSQAACSLPRTSEATPFPVESSSSVSSQASLTEPAAAFPSRIPSTSARCHEAEATPPGTERRRTVVEICEKVVVPQGKTPTTPPVTPFITVNRVNDKPTSPATEVRHDQQQQQQQQHHQQAINVSKKS